MNEMKLRDLLAYDDIVIQCHDNPDADTLACGYAVYRYLCSQGKKPRLIYGGSNRIRKSNLVMFVEDLQIPIEHVDRLEEPELLLTVDCQYTGGNVMRFPAQHVAVLDHHRVCTQLPVLSKVRSKLGACSTLIWQMLKEEGYDVDNDKNLATALYYGLYTDTGSFAEIVHPLDKDLRDEAKFDATLMVKYRNANLSLEELEVAGAALLHSDYMDEYRCAIVKSAPCDPNILGLISDLVLEVDAVSCCIVFNVLENGVKLSVRSCVKEIKASELAAELCKDIGSGGGHAVKAGGFIQMELLVEEYLKICEEQGFTPRMELDAQGQREQPTASGIKVLLERRMRNYMDNTDILYANHLNPQKCGMETFSRRPIPWGYVYAKELFEPGQQITIRTINGDEEVSVDEDTILTIAPKGEVYMSSEAEFKRRYRFYPDWSYHLREAEYRPTIKLQKERRVISPMKSAHVCVPKGSYQIQARQLDHKVKLFRDEAEDTYLLGREGDYLVEISEEPSQFTVMERELFEKTYHRASVEPEAQTAVVFDLDGTLLDTLEDLKDAVNAALMYKNLPTCSLEQVRQYVGNGIRKLIIRAVPEGEANPAFEDVFAYFKTYYREHCMDHTVPYRNVMHMLQELHAQKVPMAIVSNKIDFAVKELRDRYFAEYIDVALGEMEGVQRKPAPDMVDKAILELGVSKENAIYVGDSDVDIQTAANAGLPCVSVTWGFRDKSFLKEHGAQAMIQRPLELLYHI